MAAMDQGAPTNPTMQPFYTMGAQPNRTGGRSGVIVDKVEPLAVAGIEPVTALALSTASAAAILAVAPVLRAYARSRLNSHAQADDAVQDTLERAWRSRASFIEGSNLVIWMQRILRNKIIDNFRRERWTVEDAEGQAAGLLVSLPDQHVSAEYNDLIRELESLSPQTRTALLLTGIGVTDLEASEIMGVPLGTIKSYVRRGRVKLKAAGVWST
jgi:RNA polymerase sigma factor (sigma-70 family)